MLLDLKTKKNIEKILNANCRDSEGIEFIIKTEGDNGYYNHDYIKVYQKEQQTDNFTIFFYGTINGIWEDGGKEIWTMEDVVDFVYKHRKYAKHTTLKC